MSMLNSMRNKVIASVLALSSAGLVAITTYEGIEPVAYRDAVGIPTICAGHTKGVKIGQKETIAGCLVMLHEDATEAGKGVASCTTARVTQAQYDALVSLAFNIGTGAYCKSTLVRKLNARDCLGAADEFMRWNKAGGRVLPGLTYRRQKERAGFLTGCEGAR